jgi:hypothetical protein
MSSCGDAAISVRVGGRPATGSIEAISIAASHRELPVISFHYAFPNEIYPTVQWVDLWVENLFSRAREAFDTGLNHDILKPIGMIAIL